MRIYEITMNEFRQAHLLGLEKSLRKAYRYASVI
jgi:hypothetical protein